MFSSEKEYENYLVTTLKKGPECKGVWIVDPITGAREEIWKYLQDLPYEVIQDNTNWKSHEGISPDLIGGMVPDIVVNSKISNQNRILIEVKWEAKLNYGLDDSQLARYFLYLLSATTIKHKDAKDLKRAVLLAAPQRWYKGKNSDIFNHFVDRLYKIGEAFEIKIGKIECDALET